MRATVRARRPGLRARRLRALATSMKKKKRTLETALRLRAYKRVRVRVDKRLLLRLSLRLWTPAPPAFRRQTAHNKSPEIHSALWIVEGLPHIHFIRCCLCIDSFPMSFIVLVAHIRFVSQYQTLTFETILIRFFVGLLVSRIK